MTVLDVLNDSVAQELLASTHIAKLAYTWKDGSPRVVPIWFQWNGDQIVMASPVIAPKVKAIAANPRVAVTIDGSDWPYHALAVRGSAEIDYPEGVVPEYAKAANRYFGPEGGPAWISQVEAMAIPFARFTITPDTASILDFETRFPSAIAHYMR
jgi:hypothetical protein